ncbi:MAG: efflux transporter outer membrane subunit [Alphaproteobacteria bacterium]|nr:efflux transporter outer membrane subunit [Alphaproteobacteria bacterium]
MRKTLILSLSLSTLLLSSCTLVPDYERPAVSLPPAWGQEGVQSSVDEATAWWENFTSPELNALMKEARANNTGLLAGIERVEQARASLKIAGADLVPSVTSSAGATRSRSRPTTGKTTSNTNLNAGIDISYELDLFGANRAALSASEANFQGSIYDQAALDLTLMGDVANGYFTLINLRERLKVADENLAISREVLAIIAARVREGAESELELAQQKSAVASSEAARTTLAEQIENAENALSVLLGKAPRTLEIKRTKLDGLKIPAIAPGQPSALLERRPDLLSAEAGLLAANADIGAARAAFFPSVSLGLGKTIAMAGFGAPSSSVLSLASSLGQPIFEGGRLEGGVKQATARQKELVQTYRGKVLTAFQEVEDALAAVKSAQMRENSLKTAKDESIRAWEISKRRYDAGSIDFQTLLDTQKARLSAEDSYVQARLARLNAAVTLYRALGGGWSS